MHGHGGAGDWAARAEPGARAAIGDPRGSFIIPINYDWCLLAGDASAPPAVARRLEELPAGSGALGLVELADPADERRFGTAADMQFVWVRDATQWLAASGALHLPPRDGGPG